MKSRTNVSPTLTQARLHHPGSSLRSHQRSGPGYNWLIEDCGISASLRGLISPGGDAPDGPAHLWLPLSSLMRPHHHPQRLLHMVSVRRWGRWHAHRLIGHDCRSRRVLIKCQCFVASGRQNIGDWGYFGCFQNKFCVIFCPRPARSLGSTGGGPGLVTGAALGRGNQSVELRPETRTQVTSDLWREWAWAETRGRRQGNITDSVNLWESDASLV